jgi:hypothetical protein
MSTRTRFKDEKTVRISRQDYEKHIYHSVSSLIFTVKVPEVIKMICEYMRFDFCKPREWLHDLIFAASLRCSLVWDLPHHFIRSRFRTPEFKQLTKFCHHEEYGKNWMSLGSAVLHDLGACQIVNHDQMMLRQMNLKKKFKTFISGCTLHDLTNFLDQCKHDLRIDYVYCTPTQVIPELSWSSMLLLTKNTIIRCLICYQEPQVVDYCNECGRGPFCESCHETLKCSHGGFCLEDLTSLTNIVRLASRRTGISVVRMDDYEWLNSFLTARTQVQTEDQKKKDL